MMGIFYVISCPSSENGSAYAVAGEIFSMITEFSDLPRAKASLVYGNSIRPSSKHIGDQLELFSKKRYRPVYLQRDEIMNNCEKIEEF
jgi:acyl-homoserine-lactone acylase